MGHMNGNDVNKDSATPNREMPNGMDERRKVGVRDDYESKKG
jgi:hypothetical protein